MFGFAGWYDERDWRTTVMFYVEWSHLTALGPLVWLYFKAITNADFRWQLRYWWHFLPAGLFALIPLLLLGYDYLVHAGLRGEPFADFGGTRGPAMEFAHGNLNWIGNIEDLFIHLQLPIYLVLTALGYRAYRNYIAEEFAAGDEFDLNGLRVLLYILIGGVFFAFASDIIAYSRGIQSYADVWPKYFFISLLVFASAIQFYALTPRRTRSLRFRAEPLRTNRQSENSNERQPSTTDYAVWIERLERQLEKHEDYLQPDLKLGDLAGRIGTNASILSAAINSHYAANFNDFINGKRCEAFLTRLQRDEHHERTLLSLALDSGFNSKSTFNRAFRKRYGYPPGEAAARLGSD